ncbi:MAG: DUF3991 and toprim domain-containing protein [Candidatus Pelethousia sp.]|nr:DUF3991 and toprim domain-containing protein [Candidatus Pelethousia sp.]
MPGVSKEQIERAKEIDLLSYLQQYEPQELKRTGPHEYCTVTHDSLKISNGKWHWFSRGIGGKTALDYLIKVRDMDFVEAVSLLCNGRAAPAVSFQQVKKPEPPPKPFELPEPNRDNGAAIDYLRGRGIDPEIIYRCIQAGILYESREYHNCVFVGKDAAGISRFASVRGTYGDFKQDIEGSDKRYNFVLPSCPPSSRFVAVCESAIDALSLATIRKRKTGVWDRYHYLSLSGTSPLALRQYLTDHPEIDHVYMYLDNDKAGRDGMMKLRAALMQNDAFRDHITSAEPPPIGKDYNEYLQHLLQKEKEKKPQQVSRPKHWAAISR